MATEQDRDEIDAAIEKADGVIDSESGNCITWLFSDFRIARKVCEYLQRNYPDRTFFHSQDTITMRK